ncbi:MAG TPA: hypothetical protein VHD83_23505 [Puia sp.]|nr:hypothetical protein [Puia sp.]
MYRLFFQLLCLFTAASMTTSCGNSSSAAKAGNPDASFSCVLDGKTISGKGTDQNINAAFHLTGDDKGQIFFRLSDPDNTNEKFMFQVPGKTGATTFTNSPTYSYSGYMNADMASYTDDPVTVTITSISATRVSGTFSGKYSWQKGTGSGNAKPSVEVTDGKFDIPFSTSAQWKQLYHAE